MSADNDIVVQERRRRLREWINSHYAGVQAAFVEHTGINQGEVSGLLKSKSFGEKRARSLEEKAGMPAFYLDQRKVEDRAPRSELSELRSQVESLTVVLASLVDITAKHRPLEGEELARVIRGNESLDLVQHDLVADILELLGPKSAPSAKPAARARARSPS